MIKRLSFFVLITLNGDERQSLAYIQRVNEYKTALIGYSVKLATKNKVFKTSWLDHVRVTVKVCVILN